MKFNLNDKPIMWLILLRSTVYLIFLCLHVVSSELFTFVASNHSVNITTNSSESLKSWTNKENKDQYNNNNEKSIKSKDDYNRIKRLIKRVYPEVETVVGSTAELPCNISAPHDDIVQLILWFKSPDGTGPPLLTLDSRLSSSLTKASLVIGPGYEGRIHFNLSQSPSILSLTPVKEEDASIYSCRVDYKWGRTSITNIKLFIIASPSDVIISDPQSGLRLGNIAGPYPEDSQLRLNCVAVGGKPPPSLVWYLDNQLIDDSYEINNQTGNVVNELVIEKLIRSYPDSVLTCKATNHASLPPISASTRLDLYLKPSEVRIYPKKPLRSGQKTELTCESKGSKPTTRLTWYINGRELKDSRPVESSDEEVTSSIVSFTPMPSHNGLPLICRAENPKMINSSLYDNWLLQVHFRPKLNLTLFDGSQPVVISSQIKMKCDIQSSPNVTEIHWLFNNEMIKSDDNKGTVIQGSILTLNVTSKDQAGIYECLARNSEGTGKSNQLDLKIHYEPTCLESDPGLIYEVPIGETVNISCNVDSKPVNVTFWWKFMSNSKSTESSRSSSHVDLVKLPFSRNQIIRYQVNSSSDYGILLCGAENSVGKMRNYCQFRITASTVFPYPPESCHLTENTSESSYLVECLKPRKLGPWKETYFLEIYDRVKPIVLINDDQPYFKIAISELPSNESTTFIIYSRNGVGKSSDILLSTQSQKMLERQASNPEDDHPSKDLLFILVGLTSICALIGILTILLRVKRRRQQEQQRCHQQKSIISKSNDANSKTTNPSPSLKSNKVSPESSKIRTPDVIPLRIHDSVDRFILPEEKWQKDDILEKNGSLLAASDNYGTINYHPDYSDSNMHVQLVSHDDDSFDPDKMGKLEECFNEAQFVPVLIQFPDTSHIMKNNSQTLDLMETQLPLSADIQPYSMSTPV